MGYSPRGVCNQGLVAFLVVTPSRAGCKLTAIFPAPGLEIFSRACQSAGWLHMWRPSPICSSSPLVPNHHTHNGEGRGGFLSAPPLALTFAPFIKTGFAKILSSFVISFNLPGFRCVRVCVKYQLIRLLATRLVYQLRFVTVTRCFSNFLHYVC